jgi:putative flippase GtrA
MKLKSSIGRYERPIRFVLAGGFATLLYSGLTIGLVQSRMVPDPVHSSAIASVIAIPVSFLAHKVITFTDVRYEAGQWRRYLVLAAANLAVNVGLVRLGQIAAVSYTVMIAVGWILVPTINYVINALWVFRAHSLLALLRDSSS